MGCLKLHYFYSSKLFNNRRNTSLHLICLVLFVNSILFENASTHEFPQALEQIDNQLQPKQCEPRVLDEISLPDPVN